MDGKKQKNYNLFINVTYVIYLVKLSFHDKVSYY